MSKPTFQQIKLAREIFKRERPGINFKFIKAHTETSYKTWRNTWDILPLFFNTDLSLLCCVEVGFGHAVVFDLRNDKFFYGKNGIFEETWCYLMDYYGFHAGAVFKRSY